MTVAVLLAATVAILWSGCVGSARAGTADDVARVRALECDGRVDLAVDFLRELLTDNARDRDPALLLELARLTDDAAEAIALADDVLREARTADLRARAHVMRGDYLYAAGRYERASVEYEAAARERAHEDADLRRAASLLATGDVAGAVRIYEGLADHASSEIAAWAAIGRGRALLAGDDPAKAVPDLEETARALAGREERAYALAALAEAHVVLGDLEAARNTMLDLVAEFPGSFEATIAASLLRTLEARIADGEEPVREPPGDPVPVTGQRPTVGTDGADE